MTFAVLPPEVVIQVFSYFNFRELCGLALVSRAWHLFTLDGMLPGWRDINLYKLSNKYHRNRISDRILAGLFGHPSRLTHLRSLNLSTCGRIEDSTLQQIGKLCPRLASLNVHECPLLTDDGVVAVCAGCPGLLSLVLSGCVRITDESLQRIGVSLPNLKALNVAGCRLLTSASIKLLGSCCPNLEQLILSGCGKIRNDAIIHVVRNCRRLTNLQLAGLVMLSNESLSAIGEYCSEHLMFLTIAQMQSITDKGLACLHGLQCIRTLSISQCNLLSHSAVDQLRSHLPAQAHLRFSSTWNST